MAHHTHLPAKQAKETPLHYRIYSIAWIWAGTIHFYCTFLAEVIMKYFGLCCYFCAWTVFCNLTRKNMIKLSNFIRYSYRNIIFQMQWLYHDSGCSRPIRHELQASTAPGSLQGAHEIFPESLFHFSQNFWISLTESILLPKIFCWILRTILRKLA